MLHLALIPSTYSSLIQGLPMGAGKQEELIDIQTDETAKNKHKECSCSINGVIILKPSHSLCFSIIDFPSTWECEQGFSASTTIKSKILNRLASTGHDFQCAVRKIIPRINQLMEKKTTIFL